MNNALPQTTKLAADLQPGDVIRTSEDRYGRTAVIVKVGAPFYKDLDPTTIVGIGFRNLMAPGRPNERLAKSGPYIKHFKRDEDVAVYGYRDVTA